jgi:hypothetical protein
VEAAMTEIVLADKTKWKVSQLPVSPYVRAGELIAALSKVSPGALICVADGPLTKIVYEPHANEPFVVLEYVWAKG